MTIQQAMTEAMKTFEKNSPKATILRVSLSECFGNWRTGYLSSALIHIEFTIDDDNSESRNYPVYVRVEDVSGRAVVK